MNSPKIYSLVLFFLLFLFLNALGNSDSISNIQRTNNEIKKSNKNISSSELESLFEATMDLAENGVLVDYFDNLAIQAFDTDNFDKIDSEADNFKPLMNITIGGDAVYVCPNISFFKSNVDLNSVDYQFYSLAESGFYGSSGKIYGGQNLFPAWIKQTTGITGEIDNHNKEYFFKEWLSLRPLLERKIHQDIANATIKYLDEAN